MDHLPGELLTKVCNYLPWNEKLTARRLSSHLNSISCDLINLQMLGLREEGVRSFKTILMLFFFFQNVFSFTVQLHGNDRERWAIKIIKWKDQRAGKPREVS